MDFATRLAQVQYNGVMDLGVGEPLTLFTDPVTKSTFSVQRNQRLGEALEAFIARWDAAEQEAA
jgi:hypothetical protein